MTEKETKKGFFSFILDVRKWANVDEITDNARAIAISLKNLQKHRESSKYLLTDTFDEVMRMLNVTEDEIKRRTRYFLYCSITYFVTFVGLLVYTIYLAYSSSMLLSTLTSLVLSLVMLVYALREHFWYTQMKMRKFGCGFKDWVNFTFTKQPKQ